MPAAPYALAFHATSRDDKLWPEERWRGLLAHFAQAGFAVLLPWGSDAERARSERLARDATNAIVPPRQSLPELASLARSAEIVVGVDTGLTHLAAALGTPTVALFTATDATLAGVARAGTHAQRPRRQRARPRRSTTRSPPRAACCATRRDADAKRSTRCCGTPRCRWLPLRLWWRGRREPGYREKIGERFGRYAAPTATAEGRRSGSMRCRSARRAPPRRWSTRARAASMPDATILLTHMTATGREAGRRAVRRSRRPGVAAVRRAVCGARVPRAASRRARDS